MAVIIAFDPGQVTGVARFDLTTGDLQTWETEDPLPFLDAAEAGTLVLIEELSPTSLARYPVAMELRRIALAHGCLVEQIRPGHWKPLKKIFGLRDLAAGDHARDAAALVAYYLMTRGGQYADWGLAGPGRSTR